MNNNNKKIHIKCIQKSIKFRGKLFFLRIVLKLSISKWNILKSQHMLKLLWNNVWKSRLFGTLLRNFLLLFQPPESSHSFCKYMSSKHQNRNFTVEHENISSLALSDIRICHKYSKFVTNFEHENICSFWLNLSESTQNLPESSHSLCKYVPSKHQNRNFTAEYKNIGSLSLLGVKIFGKYGKFVPVYGKSTFCGVFTNSENFIAAKGRVFLHTLRYFIWESIIWRLSLGKTITFRISLICVLKNLLTNCIHLKVNVQNVPKRNVFVMLLILGSTSFQIGKKLQKSFTDKLMSCTLKVVFTSAVKVKTLSPSR